MTQKKVINLKVNKLEDFIKQYLNFINPFNILTSGESNFLAELLVLPSSLIEDDDIFEVMLLDYNNKQLIMSKLNITEARLNNIISSLRKKNVIIKTKRGNKLHSAYDMRDKKLPYSFEINWESNED